MRYKLGTKKARLDYLIKIGPQAKRANAYSALGRLEVFFKDALNFLCRFGGILHGVVGRHNLLRTPGDVAGPIGHHAIRAFGGIIFTAVADDGVGGHIAHGQAP